MADPVYLTINEFPGTGAAAPTVVDFNFAGGYISPAHVKAEIFNPVTYLRTPVTVTDDNFVTDYRLSLPVVVPPGSILRVYRDTPKAQPLVDFTNGARIAENNLDLVARQAVFVAAESTDQIEATQVADVLQAVEAAALSAATAQVEADASAASAALSQAASQEGASIAGGFALAAASSAAVSSAAAATSTAAAAEVRSDLASRDGGTLVTLESGRTVQLKSTDAPTLEDFGASESGDSYAAIQAAIVYCIVNKRHLRGTGRNFSVSQPIVIPRLFDYSGRSVTLDLGGSTLTKTTDSPTFVSGYMSGGVPVATFGGALGTHYSQGIKLENFHIGSAIGQLTQPQLQLQDWYQGCAVQNVSSRYAQTLLHSRNNFYAEFHNLVGLLDSATKIGDRFIFSESHNLNRISGLVAPNAATGYRFDGPVTACQLTNMSFEGQTRGAVFNAAVYDLAVDNSYAEAIDDVVLKFNDYVFGATLRNNYFNFLNSAGTFLLEYAGLPGGSVEVDASNAFENMPSAANIIKNREDSYGDGVVIRRATTGAGSLNDLVVDNSIIGRKIEWMQKRRMSGILANVNNELVPGNYSGKFSTGYVHANGFEWVNNENNTLTIRTRITRNFVQIAYVNITVAHSAGPTIIRGMFIGDLFYEFTGAGLVASTKLTAGAFGGYLQIDGGIFFNTAVTGCTGEVRLV